jgi:hypothetical protein
VVLQKIGHQHPLAGELRHRLRMRAALGWKAAYFEPLQDPGVLLDTDERPPGREHTSHPTGAVAPIDPERPGVERHQIGHADAVALLQVGLQILHARLFQHPAPTIPADARDPAAQRGGAHAENTPANLLSLGVAPQ